MTTISSLAALINPLARGPIDASLADKLSLHLFDALGALAAGITIPDIQALFASDGSGTSLMAPLRRASLAAAAIRSTEIDDIHLEACVTPSAAVAPIILQFAQGEENIGGLRLLNAYLCGVEAMIRFAAATGGPRLMRSGIWPSRLAAPLGAAAAASAILSLDEQRTAHALAIAAAMAGGLSARGGVPSTRWLIFGRAVGDGLAAARAAAAGMKGDPSLLDGAWCTATGIELDPRILLATEGRALAVRDLGLKPWCAARQTIAAISGFLELLQKHDFEPAALARIEVEVPREYAAMIDQQEMPASRPASFANLRYLLGLASFAPRGLLDVRRDDLRIDSRFDSLARIVRIEATDDFSASYPAHWPARVSVETKGGTRHSVEVTDIPGDAARPLPWDEVEGKIAEATGLARDQVSRLAEACRALPKARDGAALKSAVAASLTAVDEGRSRP